MSNFKKEELTGIKANQEAKEAEVREEFDKKNRLEQSRSEMVIGLLTELADEMEWSENREIEGPIQASQELSGREVTKDIFWILSFTHSLKSEYIKARYTTETGTSFQPSYWLVCSSRSGWVGGFNHSTTDQALVTLLKNVASKFV